MSIGLIIYPQDSAGTDQLIRHASQAMYTAKLLGKRRWHLFDLHNEKEINLQRKNLKEIKTAHKKGQFILFYQPKVNMKTGEVIGAEALIRWQHPERGLIFPDDFLPIIENQKIALYIGEWVIESALKQIAYWQSIGLRLPVSVNVSAHQLQHQKFVDKLSATLALYPEVNPNCLELEILETSALADISEVSTIMYACLKLGVSFSLDDFGTGYSSLTYLKHLPAKYLKIDRSFVRDMLEDPDDQAIVKGVIGLANAFNRKVIAEGVECIAHGSQLLAMGCELGQGYGIARPMPAIEIATWVKLWKPNEQWCK